MAKLSEIEGIGEAYSTKLEDAGITSLENLLEICCVKKGRKEMAEKSGISEKLILEWVNRADLSRIKGVSTQYADLLECAGVDTVPELAQRKPENLLAKMIEVNEEKSLVRKVPTESQVQDWVAQAKELPRVITH
jgi:predicted flap endonuclease-1-like 5' DNA nuclease